MSPGARNPEDLRERPPRGDARRAGRRQIEASALVLLFALGGPLLAGDSTTERRAAGDGRGLATFGDRGLSSFGDRFDASFGRRDLTTFSDTPLAPMGGLVPGGVAAPKGGANGSRGCSQGRLRFTSVPSSSSQSLRNSVASLTSGFVDAGFELLMPRVELPAIVLDHRPAQALLDATLDVELRRAADSGDADLVRSLDPDRR
jgi:hypothetical protein